MKKNFPAHIDIIPDGNRRWARKKILAFWKGHESGVKTFKRIVDAALELEIPYITFWAASEDNLKKRTREEVRHLVALLQKEVLSADLRDKLIKSKTRLRFLGKWKEILNDDALDRSIRSLEAETGHFTDHRLTILFGYDGRTEMVEAIEKITKSPEEQVDFDAVKKSLWTDDLPPVDVVIRTGEERSGWMHWSSGFMM